MKAATDPLRKTVQDIREYAQKAGLVIFYGLLYENAAEISWIREQGGDWTQFIEAAKALGIKLLYLNWAPFEEFQVDEALEDAEATSHSSESEKAETKREIEKYRDKVGLISLIDIAFILDGAQHTYHLSPEWFDTFLELTPTEEEEEPAREEPDKTVVDKWASALANHPQFGSCKTYGQREYLLEGLAKDKYDGLPVPAIVSRAESIYLVEVRPQEDERLRTEALKLREGGMTLSAIRLKLGISKDRLSAILAE